MEVLDLPVEIVRLCIEYTLPLGYEPFMLSCKTVYKLGAEFRERHNHLKRRFKDFRYHEDIEDSHDFLQRITQDPLAAEYIRTAYFTNGLSHKRIKWSSVDIGERDRVLTDAIKQSAMNSNLSGIVNISPQKLLELLDPTKECVVTAAILLPLLPNVLDLSIPHEWLDLPPPFDDKADNERVILWKVLDTVAQNAGIDDLRDGTLSKLTSIVFRESTTQRPVPLSYLCPFLILPSLTRIQVSGALAHQGHHSGRPFNWRYPLRPSSSLQRLDLNSSCIDGTELAKLLSHTPLLRIFTLSYASQRFGCGRDWDANAVFEALRLNLADSLTELRITIVALDGHIKGGLQSLKNLVKLKHLELDVRVFFGPPIVTEKLRAMSATDYRTYTYEVVHWNGLSVPNVAEMLPASVQTVTLLAGSCREDILILKGLFAQLEVCKADNWPNVDSFQVIRATRQLGNRLIHEGQPETAWKSVGDRIQELGWRFGEMDNV